MNKPEKNIGSLLFALWNLTNSKPKARVVSKCIDAAIRIAMDSQEYEIAASLRDLREQLIDVPHGRQDTKSITESEAVHDVPFQPIKPGVYQLPSGEMVAVD